MKRSINRHYKKMARSKYFEEWLNRIPIIDPVERKQASLIQIMLLFLIVATLPTLPIGIIVSEDKTGAIFTSIGSLIATLFFIVAMMTLRKGLFRRAVIIAATGFIVSLTNILMFEGLRGSGWILSAFMMPITLAGLLTGRKGVLIIAGISCAIILGIGILQLTTTGIVARYPREGDVLPPMMSTFIASVGISTFLFHRFAASLRDALNNALDREKELQQIRDNLEITVQARTAELEEKNRDLHQGLILAHDIQLGLLPKNPPWDKDNLDVQGFSIAAFEVGGDFYTYIPTNCDGGMIAIGDISGKGVGAALLMALTMSALETEAQIEQQPARLLDKLNQLLMPRLRTNAMNAAVALVKIDYDNQLIEFANAGMIAPILIRKNAIQFLDVAGFPLGSAKLPYREIRFFLEPHDLILLVSDGVVEAHNHKHELYGFDRLERCLAYCLKSVADLRHMITIIINDVNEFIGSTEQHDDMTIVAIRPCVAMHYGVA